MTEKDKDTELDADLALTDEDTDDVAGGKARPNVHRPMAVRPDATRSPDATKEL